MSQSRAAAQSRATALSPAPDQRQAILAAVRNALEPLAGVHALFEGGSAAFGLADELSDLDLVADVEPGDEDQAFAAVEAALTHVAPIAVQWNVPTPAWHGMTQRFYRLEGSPDYLLVDLTLRPADKPELFAERELHGEPVVYFDKRGLVQSTAVNEAELAKRLAERVTILRANLALFEHLVPKEVARGHPIDALAFYQGLVLRPLVEALRIRYCPPRHSFGMRYLDRDLPGTVVDRLRPLLFVTDADDLLAKHDEAAAWCAEELEGLGKTDA